MRRIVGMAIIALGWAQGLAWAGDEVAAEMRQDVVLRALVDELERNQAGLKLADLERPYFIEFGLTDTVRAYASADLGAITGSNLVRGRGLTTDVRVGSYTLDNSNFSGGGGLSFGGRGGGMTGADMPIEDDYNAIRQAIWWTADRDYKGVVEQLAQKKAFMESKMITDKPEDFSRAPATVYLEERAAPTLDLARLETLAGDLSTVFREFPDVQNSGVSVGVSGGNKYLVNTEGTRLRTGGLRLSISASATVQADDGMKLGDSLAVYGRKFEELPTLDELKDRCRQMARRLIDVKNAPVLTSYTGPVLFEPEAAAAIFARQFGGALAGGQRPVGSRSSPDDFANKLGKRILPRFINVVDDPAQEIVAGTPVMGHYVYDDQAVKAQAVKLIEGGKLKMLLMSRNPSKEFKQSNGHGRGGVAFARAAVGCLTVTAEPATDAAGLKQELLDACADEGLEFGIRIASLGAVGDGGGNPLVMYKVYPDGREELVRGAEIARIDLKAFKRVLAAGDTPYVLNMGGADGSTVVVPALLFEELDLAKIDRDFDKPPLLPNPLRRERAQ
jgi:hypothetical protein